MAATHNRKRHVAITAPPEAWQRLGHLLEGRRRELGHTWRTTFENESGINRRLAADIETAARERINHFTPGTFQLIAKGYQVTEESMTAVLLGDADELTPRPEAADDSLPAAPIADPGREAAVRPYADRIWQRLLALRGGDTTPGGQLFPGSRADASAWDGTAGRMDLGDRVWLVADLQRRADSRTPGSQPGANSA